VVALNITDVAFAAKTSRAADAKENGSFGNFLPHSGEKGERQKLVDRAVGRR
jgi:hypothetical protein